MTQTRAKKVSLPMFEVESWEDPKNFGNNGDTFYYKLRALGGQDLLVNGLEMPEVTIGICGPAENSDFQSIMYALVNNRLAPPEDCVRPTDRGSVCFCPWCELVPLNTQSVTVASDPGNTEELLLHTTQGLGEFIIAFDACEACDTKVTLRAKRTPTGTMMAWEL